MKLFYKVLAIGFPILLLYVFSNKILYSEATKGHSDRLVLHSLDGTKQNEGDGVEETNDLKPSSDDTQQDATGARTPSFDHILHNEQINATTNKTSGDSYSDFSKSNDEGNNFFTQALLLSEGNKKKPLYEEMNDALKKKTVESNKTSNIPVQESKNIDIPFIDKSVNTRQDKKTASIELQAEVKNVSVAITNQNEDKGKTTQGNETANISLISGKHYNHSVSEEKSSNQELPDNLVQFSKSDKQDNKQNENFSSAEQNIDNAPAQLPVKHNNISDYNIIQLYNNDTNRNEAPLMRSKEVQEIEGNNLSPKLPKLPMGNSKSAEPKTTWTKQHVNESVLTVLSKTVLGTNVNQSDVVSRKKRNLHQEETNVSESERSPTELFDFQKLSSTLVSGENIDVNAIKIEHKNKPPRPPVNYYANGVSQPNDDLGNKSEVPPEETNGVSAVILKNNITGTDQLTHLASGNDNGSVHVTGINKADAEQHENSQQDSINSNPVNQDVNAAATEPATDNNDSPQTVGHDSVYVARLMKTNNDDAVKYEKPQLPVNNNVNTTATEPVIDNNDSSQHARHDSVHVVSLVKPNNDDDDKHDTPQEDNNSSSPVNQDANTTATEPSIDNAAPQRATNVTSVVGGYELPAGESSTLSPLNATDNNEPSLRAGSDNVYVVSLNKSNNAGAEEHELSPQEIQASNDSNPALPDLLKLNTTTVKEVTIGV